MQEEQIDDDSDDGQMSPQKEGGCFTMQAYQLNPIEIEAAGRQEEYLERARNFKGFEGHILDDIRDPTASKHGGFELSDKVLSSRLRSVAKEILKSIGKQMLSGKFNLTTVSFPIKCMCPRSMLELIGTIVGTYPLYLNTAA